MIAFLTLVINGHVQLTSLTVESTDQAVDETFSFLRGKFSGAMTSELWKTWNFNEAMQSGSGFADYAGTEVIVTLAVAKHFR